MSKADTSEMERADGTIPLPEICVCCGANADDGHPYRVRLMHAGIMSLENTFSNLGDFNEALRLLDLKGADYLYRGPGWEGGSMRISQAAHDVWQLIAQPARRPPKRTTVSVSNRAHAVA